MYSDELNVGTVSSSLLKKQNFGDLSTVQISERGGVDQEKRYWRVCNLARKTSSSQTGRNRCKQS